MLILNDEFGVWTTVAGRTACAVACCCFAVLSYLAEIPWEASQAKALKAIDFILTATAVQTRSTRTLIDVPLAMLAGKARGAYAPIAINQILKEKKPGFTSGSSRFD